MKKVSVIVIGFICTAVFIFWVLGSSNTRPGIKPIYQNALDAGEKSEFDSWKPEFTSYHMMYRLEDKETFTKYQLKVFYKNGSLIQEVEFSLPKYLKCTIYAKEFHIEHIDSNVFFTAEDCITKKVNKAAIRPWGMPKTFEWEIAEAGNMRDLRYIITQIRAGVELKAPGGYKKLLCAQYYEQYIRENFILFNEQETDPDAAIILASGWGPGLKPIRLEQVKDRFKVTIQRHRFHYPNGGNFDVILYPQQENYLDTSEKLTIEQYKSGLEWIETGLRAQIQSVSCADTVKFLLDNMSDLHGSTVRLEVYLDKNRLWHKSNYSILLPERNAQGMAHTFSKTVTDGDTTVAVTIELVSIKLANALKKSQWKLVE